MPISRSLLRQKSLSAICFTLNTAGIAIPKIIPIIEIAKSNSTKVCPERLMNLFINGTLGENLDKNGLSF